MTDQVPSKERIKRALTEWRRLGLSDEWLLNRLYEVAPMAVTYADTAGTYAEPAYPYQQNPIGSASISTPSKDQVAPCPHGHTPGLCRLCMRFEIDRLQTALRGISTCSTCEACRGAAALALSGAVPACIHPWDKVGVSGDGKPFCAECCTNLVKDPPWVTAPEPPVARCEHGNVVDPTGGYVCMKCFNEARPVLPFTHWSKDPLIPYEGCSCSSCHDARITVTTTSGSTLPPGDGA